MCHGRVLDHVVGGVRERLFNAQYLEEGRAQEDAFDERRDLLVEERYRVHEGLRAVRAQAHVAKRYRGGESAQCQ